MKIYVLYDINIYISNQGVVCVKQTVSGQQLSEQDDYMPKHLTIGNVIVKLFYAWTVFGIVVLGLRVFLLAFSASTEARFVTFILETSNVYLAPFRGIFPGRDIGATGYFDVSSLFAIIIYLFIAWMVASLISYIQLKMRTLEREHEKLMRMQMDKKEGKK